jgi:hypothetical protein
VQCSHGNIMPSPPRLRADDRIGDDGARCGVPAGSRPELETAAALGSQRDAASDRGVDEPHDALAIGG